MLIRVNVNNPGDKITEFGAGAKLYWARDNTSPIGTFSDGSGSVTLVASQTQYEIVDTSGAVGHYYRTRIGNTGGTLFDEWAPVFQAGAISAYATLDDLREYLRPPDDTDDNLLSDLLVDASEYINERCERDFYRHPQVSGTETRVLNGSGTRRLWVRPGIISLTSVELAGGTDETYSLLAAGDWGYWPPDAEASYDALILSDVGVYEKWYTGIATVRLIGAFGWEEPPSMIKRATLDLARQRYQQAHGGAETLGVNAFGTPILATGLPLSVREAIERYGWRTMVH